MKSLIAFLRGRKTYIVGLGFIVYGALAYYKVVPGPDQLATIMTGIGALAMAGRNALSMEVTRLISASDQPVIDPVALKQLEGEVKTIEAAVAGLSATKATEAPLAPMG